MKKKVVLILLVVAIMTMAFAGCVYRVHDKYISSVDDLKLAMGDKMVYPTLSIVKEFEGVEFFNAADFKDVVSIPPEKKANVIQLLYIPPIEFDSEKASEDYQYAKIESADKAYRYSITLTLNKPDDIDGKLTIYVQGTDYAKVKDVADMKDAGKTPMTLDARLEELKSLYKKNVIDAGCGIDGSIMKFQEKERNQAIRYFRDGEAYSYEVTAVATVNAEAADGTLDALMAKGNAIIDVIATQMVADIAIKHIA